MTSCLILVEELQKELMVSSQQQPVLQSISNNNYNYYVAYLHYADESIPKPSLETVQYLSKIINCTCTHWQNEVPQGARSLTDEDVHVTVSVSAAIF